MANNQKGVKMNGDTSGRQFISLEEFKAILFKILPKETVFEIIKVLPMSSSSAIS